MREIQLDKNTLLEIYNLSNSVFFPLDGFMTSKDYACVINDMHLSNGQPWTIPITLEVSKEQADKIIKEEKVCLIGENSEKVAYLHVSDVFKVHYEKDLIKIFGTSDLQHPGVRWERSRSPYRVGGAVKILKQEKREFPRYQLTPQQTKNVFKNKGWATVTGFQTRNPVHRAHEYLQRIALEITDGIFIQPLIGWKKDGDISPKAIIKSYELLISNNYPSDRAVLGLLTTPMRYAGPREAVFHAIIRRNYGCTHFIVGRDHAGVDNYYKKYEAHDLCKRFNDLGIKILTLCGPYYCGKCGCIVTEKNCKHGPDNSTSISGRDMRNYFRQGKIPPQECMREGISKLLLAMYKERELFIQGG
ncbi:MAG: sulfate adenylyltransferase [Candidatus Omnitrophica bacterium]|nr:sulfate adenylyltransferase [Candidatus Omnitrophota bacterium]